MDKPTVQDIFHRFYPAYLDQYSPSPVQAKVAHNIMNCKTGYKVIIKNVQKVWNKNVQML